MASRNTTLPRLLYASDVPVESTVAGALLMHRLLCQYPPSLLCVRETNVSVSDPNRRLTEVDYGVFPVYTMSLMRGRARDAYCVWLALTAARTSALVRIAVDFGAQAILTVSHGFGWFAAAAAARELQLPLHLICHDDWPGTVSASALLRPWLYRIFGKLYRTAASRLCISPGMAKAYENRYGVAGEVLYPSRGLDSPPAMVRRLPEAPHPFAIAYAGSLWNPGYVSLLCRLAEHLELLDGYLDLYTDAAHDSPTAQGLAGRANVRWRGFHSPTELAELWAATAAGLFLPGSYLPEEQMSIRTLFPSKLADYTAGGLPLLVWSPADSSAARWAQENPDAALLVIDEEGEDLDRALRLLRDDGARSVELARGAVEAGARDFSHDQAVAQLTRALKCGAPSYQGFPVLPLSSDATP